MAGGEGDHADRPGEYSRWPAHGPAGSERIRRRPAPGAPVPAPVAAGAPAAVGAPVAGRGASTGRGLPGEPRLALGWALLAAVAGGLILTVTFPPVGAWPLAPLGPALLVVALQGRSLRASFAVGLLFGLALFVPLLSWLINLAWYAWAALAIAEAVIFALLAVGQRVLLSLRAWPVAVAGWWVVAEALRDRWPYGFPWGRLAMSQAGAPTAPWTAIGGAPLLSFLLALTGSTLAWLLLAPGPAGGLRRRLVPALAFAGAAGLALAGGLLPVDPVPAGHPGGYGRRHPGQRAARQERARPAPGHHRDREPRGGDREAGRAGPRGSPARA